MQWLIEPERQKKVGRRTIRQFAWLPVMCRNTAGIKVVVWLEYYYQNQKFTGKFWSNDGSPMPSACIV